MWSIIVLYMLILKGGNMIKKWVCISFLVLFISGCGSNYVTSEKRTKKSTDSSVSISLTSEQSTDNSIASLDSTESSSTESEEPLSKEELERQAEISVLQDKVCQYLDDEGIVEIGDTDLFSFQELKDKFNELQCDDGDLYKTMVDIEEQMKFYSGVYTDVSMVSLELLPTDWSDEPIFPENYYLYESQAKMLDANHGGTTHFSELLAWALDLYRQYPGIQSYLNELEYYLSSEFVDTVSEEKLLETVQEIDELPSTGSNGYIFKSRIEELKEKYYRVIANKKMDISEDEAIQKVLVWIKENDPEFQALLDRKVVHTVDEIDWLSDDIFIYVNPPAENGSYPMTVNFYSRRDIKNFVYLPDGSIMLQPDYYNSYISE